MEGRGHVEDNEIWQMCVWSGDTEMQMWNC